MLRKSRSFWQRSLVSGVYECRQCGRTAFEPHEFWYRFSRHSRCPRCGTFKVKSLDSRDYVDRLHKHPLNLLQALLGASLRWCSFCRLQFHDFRKVR